MAYLKIKEWPLGYDEGLAVNFAHLDGYAVPLPPRKLWNDDADGKAVLFEQNGQKQFLVTLTKANTGGVDTVIQWVERNGLGKVATGALKQFLQATLPRILGFGPKMVGGVIGAVIGAVLIPTNKPYYEWASWTNVDGKKIPVMVLLLGF